jgi:RimJ/RimL family protein N-acetyltransferase
MLLIGTILGQDIGVLRYDTEEETAEISVYLDPGLHGLGLGAMLIAAGNRWLENEASFVKVVVARIRPENRASLRAFGEAGFQSDGADRLILQWRRNGGSDSAARFNI